mmetsp:Transcript_28715/g.48821  ORF Transcript_28715/g.48821 Transcript_28715/m.48821 type:complete len:270 (+) Transcript_28715:84-893(+)
MSYRQAKDAPADPPEDEENQSQSLLNNASPRAAAAPRSFTQPSSASSSSSSSSPAISAFDAMATATNTQNPLMLAKLVARKFILLLTTEQEEDPNTRVGFTVALLKDVILGVVFGFLTISFAIVLDHRNIIHIQSAHHLRDASYSAMSDPATLAMIEAETDMKFMPAVDYEAAKKEIEDSQTTLEAVKVKLEERTAELEEVTKSMQALEEEKEALMKDPKMAELDNFCSGCSWGGSANCGARVQYLMDTYNNAKVSAMLALMEQGKCKK